jgi:gluconokinase
MDLGSRYIVMGVSGSGKTAVARALAEATGGEWLDADDYHSIENKTKMSRGIPLNDEDRWPWLDLLNAKLRAMTTAKPIFLACSALKQKYRDRLVSGISMTRFVHLEGSRDLILSRLANRTNHFMPASLLDSQLAELEVPENAIVLEVSHSVSQLVEIFEQVVRG